MLLTIAMAPVGVARGAVAPVPVGEVEATVEANAHHRDSRVMTRRPVIVALARSPL